MSNKCVIIVSIIEHRHVQFGRSYYPYFLPLFRDDPVLLPQIGEWKKNNICLIKMYHRHAHIFYQKSEHIFKSLWLLCICFFIHNLFTITFPWVFYVCFGFCYTHTMQIHSNISFFHSNAKSIKQSNKVSGKCQNICGGANMAKKLHSRKVQHLDGALRSCFDL